MRLSDDERQDALDVLEEHVRTGRLDIDEYGTRSAKVAAARKVSELAPLFSDLPSPRPSALLASASAASIAPQVSRAPAGRWLTASAVPITAAVAIVLVLLTHLPFYVFLIPLAVALLVSRRR
ncbi:DUF1707 SHOCT-like domain-containing protein [Amycolatopsis sp. H20-H5]|uniref:DUF1707 SHOCT-like domain-containing protein n=1 Tax=Amycolatopsis sp. H20-H5 TaxID=3046309 RepID=UPI002DB67F21|nr:DUF1707 domain-containing protein [Amycolatopsis sp. H20-H5]MEC3978130.1 DUF1707 domain-containing protein [Amycolatopsis sp. H20-H5]